VPNEFAYVALIIWPFISLLFYKHLPIIHATFWTIVGGFLVLPVKTAIDFPFIPPLDKESIPVIAALIGCRYIKKTKIKLLPEKGFARWFVVFMIIVPLLSVANNQEYINGIPGLTLHDAISDMVIQYLRLLPLIIGLQIIKTYEEQLMLFKLLVVACLLYSLPILFEIRMSPQLHTWIYGFFPRSFIQQIRYDGFRPVVFIGHGLFVAMFVAVSLGAAAILKKQKAKIRNIPPVFIVIYFMVLLVLSKTLGAFLLGITLAIFLIWMPHFLIRRISLFLIFVALFYPLLSIMDYFPHESLIQLVDSYDSERAGSLSFRYYHENLLLEHAQKKILFGWGGWGRSRLEGSVTDGYWIILLGQYGLAGFVSFFGLVFMAISKGINASTSIANKSEQHLLLSHVLLVAIIMVDQLPNASLAGWMMLLIGALIGRTGYVNHMANNNKQIIT